MRISPVIDMIQIIMNAVELKLFHSLLPKLQTQGIFYISFTKLRQIFAKWE